MVVALSQVTKPSLFLMLAIISWKVSSARAYNKLTSCIAFAISSDKVLVRKIF